MEQIYSKLSDFKDKDIKIYESCNKEATAQYFSKDRTIKEASFVLFELSNYQECIHPLYIKYPDKDYFIELYKGDISCARGDMETRNACNAFEQSKYKQNIIIYKHEDNLLLQFDSATGDFNFLNKVAEFTKQHSVSKPFHFKINYSIIESHYNCSYLKLPDSCRRIEYCHKFVNNTNKFILFDYPAFNFSYETIRGYIIENDNIEELLINSVQRFRDGGSTAISFSLNDMKYTFSIETPFSNKERKAYLYQELNGYPGDGKLMPCSQEEEDKLVDLLKLDIYKPPQEDF